MTVPTHHSEVKTKKKKKKKCEICKKKLSLMDYSCRCGKFYCMKHRLPEEHQCQFDYKKLGREIVDKNNPQVVAEKVVKI